MSSYKCDKCNAEAISKCVNQRTVFPQDQMDAMITHIMKREVDWVTDEWCTVKLHVHVSLQDTGSQTDHSDGAVEHALIMIKELTDEQIHRYACMHNWVITEGECMFGCCVAPKIEKVS